jgi:hypothetical protein
LTARFLAFCLGALAVSTACGGTATGPSSAGPLRVTIQPVPTFAPSLDVAMFSGRVENVGTTAIELTFPSSCQVLPYFLDARTGQQVTPRGGGFACLTVITHASLRPGEWLPLAMTVKSGDVAVPGYIILPPGDYRIYARLEDSTYRPQSEPLAFSLR